MASTPEIGPTIVALSDSVELDQVSLMEKLSPNYHLEYDYKNRVSIQQDHDAVSRAIPETSSAEDDVSLYQLKWVEWKGGFFPIVTQVIEVKTGNSTLYLS